ncbi:ATPase [Acidobacteria bacterium ACD]|nr:MAG: ATPase [Acidobacteriota bacterium]MCE7956583.1 ATPase [Acidobacteria bacterium ACB2]MDL1949206.1 ATPase [Acidobacteria bacterium ACD]
MRLPSPRPLSELLSRARGPRRSDLLKRDARHAVDKVLFLLALVALSALVHEYGFRSDPLFLAAVDAAGPHIVGWFALLGTAKGLLADDRRHFVKTRRVDLVLFAVIGVHLASGGHLADLLPGRATLSPDAVGQLYLVFTQALFAVAIVPGWIRYSKRLMGRSVQPGALILASFLLLTAVGTGLLLLPRATRAGTIAPVDALFTAASAASVTGLTVVDTARTFTPLGKGILLVLIQAGGLGIMTLTTVFAFLLAGGSTLRQYAAMQSLVGEESFGRLRATAAKIAFATLLFEGTGAAVLYRVLPEEALHGSGRLFSAVFVSVSAFCNAGFALTPLNLAETSLAYDLPVLSTVMVLVTAGGLGVPVLAGLAGLLARRERLSVHTKLVLVTSGILVVLGTLGIAAIEASRSFAALSPGRGLLAALFLSVSSRTAGFNTVEMAALSPATLFLVVFLMWVGGSPASTAGGVKTTTLALSVLNIHAIASGKNRIELFRRQVSPLSVARAFSTALLSFVVVGVALFALLLVERAPFLDLLFEVISAVSTVGLSTGVTPTLSWIGKLVVVALMLGGRVGLLGVVIALTPPARVTPHEYASSDVLVT